MRRVLPADAAEASKVIALAIKAFETAEFAESIQLVNPLSDVEPMRIATGGRATETPHLLAINPR
jgi:hypothetical protein